MHLEHFKPHIGLRTLKTALAVMLAIAVADAYGATDSRLVFAMLGAMLTMEPTFRDAFLTFIFRTVGVLLGAVMGVLLQMLPLPQLVSIGIGVVLLITLYNVLHVHYSPLMPCLILVMLFVESNLHPWEYAFGRVWDTAIGMVIGLAINMLVLPYDNSKIIFRLLQELEVSLDTYLRKAEDNALTPEDEAAIRQQVASVQRGIVLYADQKLFLRLRRQRQLLARFRQVEMILSNSLAHVQILWQLPPEETQIFQYHRQQLQQQRELLQQLLNETKTA
ncbi:MAG: FUSC family protein [Oscillospiraceae bacterium]|nr:FUSC family protein [Oscillospiraceae bacterium]